MKTLNAGRFKNRYTVSEAYINLFGGNVQYFEQP
jgi:hypothetical protein